MPAVRYGIRVPSGLPGSVSPPAPSDRGRRVARAGECPRDRCRRRHPPRREHAAPAPAGAATTPTRCSTFFARALRAEPLPALPRLPARSDRALVEPLLEPDWDERGALSGTLGRGRRASGSSRSRTTCACATPHSPRWRSPSPTTLQGRGVGTRLLEQLAARAARHGHRALRRRGDAGEPPRCSACSRTLGFELTRELEGGEVEVAFPIARDRARTDARVDERDHVAVRASLRPFFAPRTRRRRRRLARDAARSAASSSGTSSTADFAGAAYPGQPRAASRSPGVRALPVDRRDPGRGRPRRRLRPGERRARRGRGGAARRASARSCVISAGFAEIGRARASRARSSCSPLVRAHGARLIGPNCLGIAVAGAEPERDLRAARAPAGHDRLLVAERRARARAARGGGRARASASRRSSRSGTRPTSRRTTCSSGGRTTRRPTLVLLYVESFGNPRKFGAARAARRAREADPRDEERRTTAGAARRELAHGRARRLGGRSRRAVPPGGRHPRGARSRSCSTSPRCSRASPRPTGAASRSLTNAGGLGILCADACEAAGLELPAARRRDARARSRAVLPAEASVANPVDMLGGATADDVRGAFCRTCSPTRASTR